MKQRNRTTFRPNRKLLSCALASAQVSSLRLGWVVERLRCFIGSLPPKSCFIAGWLGAACNRLQAHPNKSACLFSYVFAPGAAPMLDSRPINSGTSLADGATRSPSESIVSNSRLIACPPNSAILTRIVVKVG